MKIEMRRLEGLVNKVYNKTISINTNKDRLKFPVSPEENSPLVADFINGNNVTHDAELLQALLDDMCFNKHIKSGDYIVYF